MRLCDSWSCNPHNNDQAVSCSLISTAVSLPCKFKYTVYICVCCKKHGGQEKNFKDRGKEELPPSWVECNDARSKLPMFHITSSIDPEPSSQLTSEDLYPFSADSCCWERYISCAEDCCLSGAHLQPSRTTWITDPKRERLRDLYYCATSSS